MGHATSTLIPLLALLGACTGFRLVESPDAGVLRVYDGDQLVLGYRFGDQLAAGAPADRTRSSYVHPIVGLDGEVLTDDFPKDHLHHRGLSFMWPHVTVGDRELDLWHIKGIRSVFVRWLERSTAARHATLAVQNAWRLDDGTTICHERVRYTVHAASPLGRAIDVEYTLTALAEPIAIRGQKNASKGYGGLNLRFARQGVRRRTVITTDAGSQKDSDKKRFVWADFSAEFYGRESASGIAVLQRADHPGFPAAWTLRHYGDVNVAWPGLGGTTLEPGRPVTLAYRLWVHRGGVVSGGVAAAYARYRRESTISPSSTTESSELQ